MNILAKLRNSAYTHLFGRSFVQMGWRPPSGTPIDRLPQRPVFGLDEEPLIKDALKRVQGHTMLHLERLASLWQQVRYLDRCLIKGDLVECGVWKGGAVGMMTLAHRASSNQPSRSVHLFDSFEGLPSPRVDVDGADASAYVGDCAATLEETRVFLEQDLEYPSALLRYHVGWFKDTVPAVAPQLGDIALLRLDGDWYESTSICLEHLYRKVVKGGVVVIDDYGHWQGARRATDEWLAQLKEPVLLSHIDYTGRYWVRVD